MMSDLKKKLDFLNMQKTGLQNDISGNQRLLTRQKLEELVNKNLKNRSLGKKKNIIENRTEFSNEFEIIEYSYPLDSRFGKVVLNEWADIRGDTMSTIFNCQSLCEADPLKFIYLDTETTGLSGGTGTIPFMIGLGYFEDNSFEIRIFLLNDPSREKPFLDAIDGFIEGLDISGVVTYNGRGFDFPLMETRYVLNRKKFPLGCYPHLDFLYPARTIWKNTYETRKLGYLGDILLNISRYDDIDGSLIPGVYFDYLRSGNDSMIQKVAEHNALDLVGLSSLLLLGGIYVKNFQNAADEGEVFGVAVLNEKSGLLDNAEKIYTYLSEHAQRKEILSQSVKKLALIKKKKKLFEEAGELWKILLSLGDRNAYRELSVYLEHKKGDFEGALEFVQRGLELSGITGYQREDFSRRLERLKKKISRMNDHS